MFELSMQLAQIEQWIYQNMEAFIRNNYTLVLPLGLKYHSERDKIEYLALRQTQGYILEKDPTPIKFPLEYKNQLDLHESFERANAEVTGRVLYQLEMKDEEWCRSSIQDCQSKVVDTLEQISWDSLIREGAGERPGFKRNHEIHDFWKSRRGRHFLILMT